MSIREVLRKSKEKGLDVQIIGSGWATEQKPVAGRPSPENRLCTVTFSIGS
jgi:cell division protein FtsI (penicillin-binding protein 3)